MTRKILGILLLGSTLACNDAASGNGKPETGNREPAKPTPATARAASSAPRRDGRKVILFIGTSLTAGYGVGAEFSYPAVIQQKIDSAGLPYRVVNAGISGETSAGGLRRIDWSLQQAVDVLVVELGANDGLRGLSVDSLKHNLNAIIKRTHVKYPRAKIVVAGMEAPPNMGRSYTTSFHDAFRDVASENHAVLVPFLLAGVAAKPELNQEDGIHPTVKGHRILADTVWSYLRKVL